MSSKYYLVWNRAAGVPTYKHTSKLSAVTEAQRLANLNKGQEFLVLVVIGSAKVQPIPASYVEFQEGPVLDLSF